MKKIVFVLFLTLNFVVSQEKSKVISGTVTDGQTPLQNVRIFIDGKETVEFSDVSGRYLINAKKGDMLSYSYNGMKTVEILVEDVTRILNIEMFPDVEELKEVVVTKSQRKSQQELELEYNSNPKLIKTAYGIIDPRTAAYQIRILSEASMSSVNLCILDVLRNEFPGIVVTGDCSNGGFINVRGSNSLFNDQAAIYDIDGQILTDAPIWILPDNMKRVAVLSSFAATTKYGAIASGGVVVINTNAGSAYPSSKEVTDKTRLRNNKYNNDALGQAALFDNEPIYLQELRNSGSLREAKKLYDFYTPRYKSNYYYFVDALDYFMGELENNDLPNRILDDALATFDQNSNALKALAYILQTNDDFEGAHRLYKEIFLLRPNYAQSYLDLANSYSDLGLTAKAATMFARYDYLVGKDFLEKDSLNFNNIIYRDFNNLVSLHGNDIISENKAKKSTLEEDFRGTRLVFEWNDSEAEFELQFVNPQGHYFTDKHTLVDDSDRIRREKLLGYSCAEFLIDGSLPGTWQINAKYLGNKSLTPTYFKVSIFTDYGIPKQRKDIKAFKLGTRNINQELFKVNIGTNKQVVNN